MPQADPKLTTRRALFAAAPAAALLAAPVVAQATAADDTELIRLGEEWSRLVAQNDAADTELDDIAGQSHRLPAPAALYHRPGQDRWWFSVDRDFSKPVDAWAAGAWRQSLQRDALWWERNGLGERGDRAREILDAWDRHQEAQARFREQLGEGALKDRQQEIGRQLDEIEARITQLPARTMRGAAVKARLVRRYCDADWEADQDADGRALSSLVRDLLGAA
jgi:hypothetical protein